MTTLAIGDGETTGLNSGLGHDDPDRDKLWELAVKVRNHREPGLDGMWVWQLNVDGTPVAPAAAAVNRFHERYRVPPDVQVLMTDNPAGYVPQDQAAGTFAELAQTLLRLVSGAHWVGCVPDFDARFLVPMLHEHYGPGVTWAALPWHYHTVDVETLAAGRLQIQPPWDSDELSRRLGVEPPPPELRHTAAGDVLWGEAMYDAVFAPAPPGGYDLRTADGRDVAPRTQCCNASGAAAATSL